MIFKVYHQQDRYEVPVREKTQTVYVEGGSERDVRYKLKDHNINIEFIQRIEGAHLEYEQQNEDFKVLEL
ncbi:DNA-dependent RNA polymerase subunit epsilon [Priestia endophytica]|jgi:DNA-dependent RNA polymerase auxiliary subunit epsilon|uniref:DNA-dependent RNA polymerase subunit epsilon n=1 Tax=Priestia endophytica TaxID=135735 RepID=UPI000F52CCB3|nr:DNA-directed RNA polymerase subunit epsilon [Priestia endophytica]MED4072501.1 DNA-directed RNA polymerase subunit epsilon [Priestia endophytica]RPK12810.1 hypothetical protein FH5_03016 [Priestia endophytica]